MQLPRLTQFSRAICRGIGTAAVLIMCAATAVPALAQAGRAGAGAADDAFRPVLSRAITRLALVDVRAPEAPKDADFRVATALLGLAHELTPDDQDVLRRYIEAAYSAGDESLMLDLTRRLVVLEPRDTVAQLRLITASIARNHQTAEDRLRVYESLLGEQGRLLDPSIRSRLALDAALLLRERGDERGFREKLTLSLQLDSTHKEAAALMANVVGASGRGPLASLEAMTLLLMADPVDPNVHLGIARILAAGGAFEQAFRFHENAVNILQSAQAISEPVILERRILQWHVQGPAAVSEQINRETLVAQDAAERAIRMRQDARLPIDGMQRPEDIRLPLHMSALAALAAKAGGDEQGAIGKLNEMAFDAAQLFRRIEEALTRGEIEQAQATQGMVAVAMQVQSTRLWMGLQVDRAEVDLADNRPALEAVTPDALRIADAWLALRQGRPQEGLEALEAFAESERFAKLGVAAALEELGRIEDAAAVYERLLRDAPLEPIGAWANSRLKALGKADDPQEAAGLDRIARTVPIWVDRMIAEPRRFVQLNARALRTITEGMDPHRIRLTIRNISEIPLSVGSDRSINSRMLLAPKVEMAGEPMETMIRPEVVDLDRRLRLMPRESIEVDLWPDPGLTGWFTEMLGNRTLRMRWRVVQGFMLERVGGFRPGPFSQVAETELVQRRPLPETSLSPELLASRITNDPATSLPRLAGALRTLLLQPLILPGPEDVEMERGERGGQPRMRLRVERMQALAPAVSALADRYPTLTPLQRATLVVIVPHSTMTPLVQPLEQVILADTDPLVMSLVLVTRITDPGDEYITRAREAGDERLRVLADAVTERLRDEAVAYYARFAPGSILQEVGAEGAALGGGAQR